MHIAPNCLSVMQPGIHIPPTYLSHIHPLWIFLLPVWVYWGRYEFSSHLSECTAAGIHILLPISATYTHCEYSPTCLSVLKQVWIFLTPFECNADIIHIPPTYLSYIHPCKHSSYLSECPEASMNNPPTCLSVLKPASIFLYPLSAWSGVNIIFSHGFNTLRQVGGILQQSHTPER